MPKPTTTHISDHVDRAVARLPGYQQEAPNWNKLLTAVVVGGIQPIEDALDQLENKRHLSVAVGIQLDVIGSILNESREGRSDADYRTALQGRAAELAGSGEADRVIDAYVLITNANDADYSELQPATIEMAAFITGPDTIDDTAVLEAMTRVRAAGVQLILYVVVDTSADGFAFLWGDSADADANGDLPDDANHGWGDESDADGNGDITPGAGQGGNWARLLES